jgi:predicted aspartyl protease
VPIVLRGLKAQIPVHAIVDSGADYTFLPRDYAAHLGIDIAQCREEDCETAGGVTKQYVWDAGLDALVQGINVVVHLKTAFATTPHVLLGREDFFAEFLVSFNERAQRFTLEPYP